jgi:hypothetical protein
MSRVISRDSTRINRRDAKLKAARREIRALCQMFEFMDYSQSGAYVSATEFLYEVMRSYKLGIPVEKAVGRQGFVMHGIAYYIPRNYTDEGWAKSASQHFNGGQARRRLYIGVHDADAVSFRKLVADLMGLYPPDQWNYHVLLIGDQA